MANLTIDLSDYKQNVSDNVPDGRYTVRVDDIEVGESRTSGNTRIQVWLEVTEGPEKGSVLIDYLSVTGKGVFKVRNFMMALGLPTPRKRLSIDIDKWRGRKLLADTKMVPDNRGAEFGDRVQVQGYFRADTTSTPDPTDDVPDAPMERVSADESVTQSTDSEPDLSALAAKVNSEDNAAPISLDEIEDL